MVSAQDSNSAVTVSLTCPVVIFLVISDKWMGGAVCKRRMEERELQWVLESDSDFCPLLPSRLRMLSSLTLRTVRRLESSLRSPLHQPWRADPSLALHMWCLVIRCELGGRDLRLAGMGASQVLNPSLWGPGRT